MEKLIKSIQEHEGFSGEVYKDHLGFDTVGFGTKMPITKVEGELLLRHRLSLKTIELHNRITWLKDKSPEIQNIIYEMAYQLGVPKLMMFKKMFAALEVDSYQEAAKEGMDSLWAKQTPKRAEELMMKINEIAL